MSLTKGKNLPISAIKVARIRAMNVSVTSHLDSSCRGVIM